jgi:MoCo/4Fe-4S cofactor protein with predicted Tat translocation signal
MKTSHTAGREFWRSIDEFADDPAFLERLRQEYPSQVDVLVDPVARRTFVKLMCASLALAGFSACTRQPEETIVPYVRQPEDVIPGRPLFFATTMPLGGAGIGLIVESHEGRPTKIEGNPLHPASLGATDAWSQAAVLGLYDPDRSQTCTELGQIRPWAAFLGAARNVLNAQQPIRGAGLRILTEGVGSPTLAAQLRDLLGRLPEAKWHQWDAVGRPNVRMGARLAFGEYVDVQYDFSQADVILALDADVMGFGPAGIRYSRDLIARRRPEQADRMSRLYAIESTPTLTGAIADHRLPVRASEIELVARGIAGLLGVADASAGGGEPGGARGELTRRWARAIATDLQAHRGASVVVVGDGQPPIVHALAHAMNQALGNVGKTVAYTDPVQAEPTDDLASLRELLDDMNAGKVDALIILGGNPAYTAPADVRFADAMSKVALRVHLSTHDDETSALCQWQIPEAHFLESWSDARAFDGTASIVQPLIAPLYGGRTAHEVVAAFGPDPARSAHDIVRAFWSERLAGGITPQLGSPRPTPAGSTDALSRPKTGNENPSAGASASGRSPAPQPSSGPPLTPGFEVAWQRWLHDGVVPNTTLPRREVTLRPGVLAPAGSRQAASGLEIIFRNDPSVLDGRFANNGWLQELPKPITRLTWDNAVLMSPATAERLKIGGSPAATGGEHGQIASEVVELRYRGRTVSGAAFAVPGHPDDSVTVHLGYGRTRGGSLGTGAGFNANAIRTADAPSFGSGLEIVRSGGTYPLACTQYHHLTEGRGVVRAVTRDEFVTDPESVHRVPGMEATPPRTFTLYPNHEYEGYKWGMAVDVNACVGCSACVVACVAENNIPVVGKQQVLAGREMHWLRVDAYYRGNLERPETYFQPVPCQHCENAPCEVVCPVGATVHSSEGLNDMVYNRCVGTRYCSNNCPYKVRRFNFLLYQDWNTPSLKLGRNPDVTVRSRGVMEKCTYCVQRINAAKIKAEEENRFVRDGEIQTACQQACPTRAIVFGNLNDPSSRVAQLQREQRSYSLLGELNTRPRTVYLAAVRNVNPELGE